MPKDVLIIGAGAAGLMAAKHLCEKGKQVIICEARDRIGGRIQTISDPFNEHTELGAEFVHGNLPATLGLLKEAGISYHKTGGEWWQTGTDGDEREEEHWDIFMQKLSELKEDMTLDEVLARYFNGDRYASLRAAARGYASGFDTADPARASAIALHNEWQQDEHEPDYRPERGYGAMIGHMAAVCIKYGCELHTNCIIKEITWQKGHGAAAAADGRIYEAGKIIVTVPLGVLQADVTSDAAIAIKQLPANMHTAIQNMGMGAVIKILLQFSEAFWKNKETALRTGKNREHLGFVLSQEVIPTWWTQYPASSGLLTGWLGGPGAAALKNAPDEHLLDLSLQSLSNIFKQPAAALKQKLTAWKVRNWTNDPFSRGSYSYETTATKEARAILSKPADDTLYFAGEALHEGKEMGTVEAALNSGLHAAMLITG